MNKPNLQMIEGIQSPDVFRLLVDTVVDYAIFVLDSEGNIASWNPGAERLKGYRASEIIGKHFSIFYPPEDLKVDKPGHELRTAAEIGRHEDEGWRVRKDGTRFWASVLITRLQHKEGELIGFGKITRDLTERREAEVRYRMLVDGVLDYAIFAMDKMGYITSWNAGGERIKGYRPEEIIGKHFSVFYPEEDRKNGLPQTVLETAQREGHFEGEGWRLRKDGSPFWASVVVTPLRDGDGTLYGFSKVTRDMTDRRALLEEIKQHSKDLDESNAELESFAYSVSHDLRAPLRAISGFADALQQECSDQLDNRGIEYLNEITAAAKRMNALVQDLLDYGRVGRIGISLASTSLVSAIEAAKQQLGDIKGSLTVDVAADLSVYANPQILTQVIFNLLANAFKFHEADSLPKIHVTSQVENGVVRVSVRDNGIGIAPEHQERIWNVFERLHGRESYGGTGIGLAIVKRGMTRMNGRSGVVSQLGEGSTFWIELPQSKEQNTAKDIKSR